jgi:GNAT superfamily N-acetyltransferase
MRIERDHTGIAWSDVSALFEAVGWGRRSPDAVREAFQRSTFRAFAFEDNRLVGVGRTIDDGRFYATVVDVLVHPRYQGQGVGRAIVEDLQSRLDGFLMVTLTAAPDVQPFYCRLGWRPLSTGMIRPRSDEQARLNCPPEAAD